MIYNYHDKLWSEIQLNIAQFLRLGSDGIDWKEMADLYPTWDVIEYPFDSSFYAGSAQAEFGYIDGSDLTVKNMAGDENLEAIIEMAILAPTPGARCRYRKAFGVIDGSDLDYDICLDASDKLPLAPSYDWQRVRQGRQYVDMNKRGQYMQICLRLRNWTGTESEGSLYRKWSCKG